MSHLVKQTSQGGVTIKSLDLLGKACAKLGLTLDTSRKVAHYYGSSKAACDAVITLPGCKSDIAVFKQEDGSYAVEADTSYFADIAKALGENSDSLFQRYRAEELIEQATNDGFSVAQEFWNPQTEELQLAFER